MSLILHTATVWTSPVMEGYATSTEHIHQTMKTARREQRSYPATSQYALSLYPRASLPAGFHPEPSIVPLRPRSSHSRQASGPPAWRPDLYRVPLLASHASLRTLNPKPNESMQRYPRLQDGKATLAACSVLESVGDRGQTMAGTRT